MKKYYYKKNLVIGLILWLGFLSNSVGASRLETHLTKIRSQEPSFNEVVRVALREEKLDLDRLEEWKHKMRVAPWLPKLSAGYDYATKNQTSLSVTDNISVTSSAVTVGPSDNNSDQTLNSGNVFRVRALWSLDDLVFHSSTLAASREGRDLSKSRLELVDALFKIYSGRKELLSKYWILKKSSNPKSVLIIEKIRDLTEELDFFTNGAFANQWWRGT